MGGGIQSNLGLSQVILGRFELERKFGNLLAEVPSLFLQDSSMLSFKAFDLVLVKLCDLIEGSS